MHSAALHRSRVQWSGCSRTHLVGAEAWTRVGTLLLLPLLVLRLRLPFFRLAFCFCFRGSAPSPPEPQWSEPSSAIARCMSTLNFSNAYSFSFSALSMAPLFYRRSAVREGAFASCSSFAWRASAARSSRVRVGFCLRRYYSLTSFAFSTLFNYRSKCKEACRSFTLPVMINPVPPGASIQDFVECLIR